MVACRTDAASLALVHVALIAPRLVELVEAGRGVTLGRCVPDRGGIAGPCARRAAPPPDMNSRAGRRGGGRELARGGEGSRPDSPPEFGRGARPAGMDMPRGDSTAVG